MESPLLLRYLIDALRQRTLSPQPQFGVQPATDLRPPVGTLGAGSAERAGQLARDRRSVIDSNVDRALGIQRE